MHYLKETSHNQTLNNFATSENLEGGLNINEFKNILLRRFPTIALCTLSLTSLALLRILTAPPAFVAGFELLSEPVNIETKVTSTNEDSRKTREEITDVDLDEVQLKILKSPKLIARVIEAVQDKYPDLSYGSLTADLSVNIIADTQKDQNVLEVIYQNPDRQKVEEVVNALADTYQGYSVEKRQSGVKKGIAFLDRQIPQISARAQGIETQIAELRTRYSFNDPDASLEQISDRINQLDQRREENALKLQELKATLNNLDREIASQPSRITSASSFATPRYVELLNRLRELDLEINQKSAIFSDRSEILQTLNQEKRQLNSLIAEAGKDVRQKLANQIAVLENRQGSLAIETNNLKTKLRQWSEISGEYKSLKYQLNRTNNKLNEFISQKDALQIDAAQKDSPWQLLTPPQEPQTNDTSAINYLLLGSTLGLFFGIGIAFLIDKQQNIIYSSAKVEEITSLPILAAIPHSPKRGGLPLLNPENFPRKMPVSNNYSQIVSKSFLDFSTPSIEAFRSFAANIGLFGFYNNSGNSNSGNNLKSIAITSAISREGKSTVALNLARATASIGKRVLIVDADLRSSEHITNIFGLEQQMGLRNILEQNSPYTELQYIQKLPLEENLFILASGSGNIDEQLFNKDPSLLLASVKMHSLMEELEKQFDLVIYDLCSIIGFADVNLLANQTDGIVVVAGVGKIQTAAFTEALNQLELCKAPVMGIVLNKVINKS